MTDQSFVGKVAVVTGGASGIGRAILTRFARAGARCILADNDEEWGATVARDLAAGGSAVAFVPTDVRRSDQVGRLFAEGVSRYGGVDILVNSAGVGVHREVVDLTEEEWDLQVDVQLKGVFLTSREAARLMIRQGRGGRIINIGSTASAVARVRAGPHSASKAGVILLTRVLAVELGRHNITANVVAPGLTDVGPISHFGGASLDYQRNFIREVPLGRLAQPDEMADAVLFFASDQARFITGQVLYVDGGYSAGKMGVRTGGRE
jgi:NAD(P)-dependent dehydrogenase (short-subunit alcohol dehydrogenase family)